MSRSTRAPRLSCPICSSRLEGCIPTAPWSRVRALHPRAFALALATFGNRPATSSAMMRPLSCACAECAAMTFSRRLCCASPPLPAPPGLRWDRKPDSRSTCEQADTNLHTWTCPMCSSTVQCFRSLRMLWSPIPCVECVHAKMSSLHQYLRVLDAQAVYARRLLHERERADFR